MAKIKSYTEIYEKKWRQIVIYPFVPEGQTVHGHEASIVVSLFELKVRPNVQLPGTLTVEQWKKLDKAMKRAFEICNWSREEVQAYKLHHIDGKSDLCSLK